MISVIVPVYNTGIFLSKCIQSILDQTYSNIEIICINDGSTDNSLEILNEFASKDKRIIVISQENSGVSSARNRGLEIATGDYVTFVDSDDSLAPNMYSVLTELIQKYDADIAHCGYKRVREDGTSFDVKGTKTLIVQNSIDAATYLLSGKAFTGSLCNKLIKRELFESINFDSNIRFNEDILVCYNLFLKSKRNVFFDDSLYYYYEHKNSSCSRANGLIKAINCNKVAKVIYDSSPNEIKCISGARYYYTLIELYRARLFDKGTKSKDCFKAIDNEIKTLKNANISISKKQSFNYFFMKFFPKLYPVFYRLYDSIRTPNWDV